MLNTGILPSALSSIIADMNPLTVYENSRISLQVQENIIP